MRIYHRADKIASGGDVSALCFKTPHVIDMAKESWVLRDDAVTCQKCRKIINERVLRASQRSQEPAMAGLKRVRDMIRASQKLAQQEKRMAKGEHKPNPGQHAGEQGKHYAGPFATSATQNDIRFLVRMGSTTPKGSALTSELVRPWKAQYDAWIPPAGDTSRVTYDDATVSPDVRAAWNGYSAWLAAKGGGKAT